MLHPFALLLPMVEIVIGAALVLGPGRRGAALLSALLLLVFIAAIAAVRAVGRQQSEGRTDLARAVTTLGRLAPAALLCSSFLDSASTDIRERVAAGEAITDLVPDAVAAYIEEHGLWDDVVVLVDLPDLAAALAPRVLWIVDPRTPTKAPVSVERTHREYEPTLRAYERAGRSDAFRVLHRPEAWPMEKIYSDWLDSR